MSDNRLNIGHNMRVSPTVPIKWNRVFYPIIILLTLVVLVFFFVQYLGDPVRFPVVRVEVGGAVANTDKPQLMNLIKLHTNKGFYGLDLEDIRKEIISMPWIFKAEVRRVFPDRVYVYVEERTGVMRWNDKALIDTDGEVFYPQQLGGNRKKGVEWRNWYASLPHLRGEESRSKSVQLAFLEYGKGLKIVEAQLLGLFEDDRRSQMLILSENIVVRLGADNQKKRLDRFIRVFPKYLKSNNQNTVKFDMRYTNGFAVANSKFNENNIMGYF